ncbi:MAG: EVE domain-containing protein [Candidatus Midichloria sp.]|nr:EVE domain protein [Hyalomma marginatum]
MNYWLLKSEQDTYSWDMLKKDIKTRWDGIRNYQARNYMSQMQPGELCLFYHSGKNPAVVGIASVISKAYLDPNDDSEKFLAIDIGYEFDINKKVLLSEMHNTNELKGMKILKQTRLSISPVTEVEWSKILEIAF